MYGSMLQSLTRTLTRTRRHCYIEAVRSGYSVAVSLLFPRGARFSANNSHGKTPPYINPDLLSGLIRIIALVLFAHPVFERKDRAKSFYLDTEDPNSETPLIIAMEWNRQAHGVIEYQFYTYVYIGILRDYPTPPREGEQDPLQ